MFNIIARKTLTNYCKLYPDAKSSLEKWYIEMHNSEIQNFNELKLRYPSVSIVGDDRAIFNIMGNKYRLIVRIVFEFKAIQVKWFGTHDEYNKINVITINFKKP
ncbi:MAG: type II toxin-antitoxin system HigB family toxin [Bacteroidia bacterium]|nr:type II toxin-antitoxin system HigB family toxin [Bacteroidia bacterium]